MKKIKDTITEDTVTKEETTTKKPNLIKRAFSRLKTALKNAKISKKIATLSLTTALVVSGITFAGCSNDSHNPGPGPDPNPGPIESGYSQIMDTVLNDEYYTSLVDNFTYEDNSSAYYDPHPYGFLEDEGYNIDDIKNGSLECYSTSYMKDDGYYIRTMVENKASTDYYGCYIIKYDLTDQEKDELDMLFEDEYIQTPLYIQEISNQKSASVQSEAYIAKTAYESILSTTKTIDAITFDALGTNNVDVLYLGNYVVDGSRDSCDIQIYVRNSNLTMGRIKGKMGTLKISTIGTMTVKYLDGHQVLINPTNAWHYIFTYEAYQNSVEEVDCYNCQNTNLILDYELESK